MVHLMWVMSGLMCGCYNGAAMGEVGLVAIQN